MTALFVLDRQQQESCRDTWFANPRCSADRWLAVALWAARWMAVGRPAPAHSSEGRACACRRRSSAIQARGGRDSGRGVRGRFTSVALAPHAVVECRGDSRLSAGGKEPALGPNPGRCNDLDVAAAAVALNQPRAPSRGWVSFRDPARYRWLLVDPASRPPCRHGVSAVDVKGRGRVRYQRFLATESVPLRAASAPRASFIVGSTCWKVHDYERMRRSQVFLSGGVAEVYHR